MFIQRNIEKVRKKIKPLLMLALVVTSVVLSYNPIQSKATETNLDGENFENAVGGGNGAYDPSKLGYDIAGPSKTGWLVYLVDTSGSVVSDVVYVNVRTSAPSGYSTSNLKTRIGYKRPQKAFVGAPWGAPFDENQLSRAPQIREYLEKPVNLDGRSMAQAAKVVGYYLGQEAFDKFTKEPKKHYLVMDACAYCGIIIGTNNGYAQSLGIATKGQKVLASAYGWGQLERTLIGYGNTGMNKFGNIGDGSKGDVSWCTNRALQITCHLYENWPGLPTAPTEFSDREDVCGRLSCDTIMSYGYGELAVRGVEQEMIHTYWEPNGSPGDPEPNTGTGQQITNDDGSTSTGDKKGTCNIVKCYYTEERKGDEVTYTDDTNGYNTLKCTNVVSIDNEPNDYKLEAWATSNTLNKNLKAVTGGSVTWHSNVPSPIEKGDSETVVTLDENQTVYVLLKRVIEDDPPEDIEENYVIHQSSITKRIKISEQDGKQLENNLKNQTISWYISAHATQCGGHQVTTEVDCDGSCVVSVLHDHNNTTECFDNTGDGKCDVVYVDSEPCGKKHEATKTVYCTGFNLTEKALKLGLKETNHSGTSTVLAKIWQKVFRGNDNVTYAAIDRTSMGAVEYGTSGWDYKCVIYRGKDKLTLAEWKNTATGKTNSKLTSDLGFKSENTSKGTRKQNDYIDKFSLSFTGNSPDKETTATASTKGDGYTGDLCTDTKKLTFLGSNGSKPIAINDIGVKVEVYSGKSEVSKDTTTMGENNVPSGEEISFYPYIQMQYDTLDADDKKIYVLGEYKRSFSPTDYFKLSISGGDANGLNVNSYQWSTHAEAQKLMGDSNYLGVLPGGAMISLTTPEDTIRTVKVETQQVILKDKGLTQVQKTNGSGTNLTEEQAKANHASLVASTVQALENVYVTQFASNGGETIKVDPGTDLNKLSLSGKASTDNKYYFRADGTSNGIGEGDLDVEKTDTDTYEVTYYTEPTSSEVKGSASWDKTNTKAKLKAALELGTGNDSEASWGTNTKWYNEAFDGVTVIRQVTTLKVGLLRPTERTSILDPKLTPESTGKKDLFTKSITSYYKTTGSNRMGSFKGKQATLNVGNLYKSKSFLIPNVTTQDLN